MGLFYRPPKQPKRIHWGFFLVFAVFISACAIVGQLGLVQREIERSSLLIDLHSKGQGIVIGTSGIASLLGSLIESDRQLFLSRINIEQESTTFVENTFNPPSAFVLASRLGLGYSFDIQVVGYKISGEVLISSYALAFDLIIGCLISALFAVGHFFSIKRYTERLTFQSASAQAELAHQVAHDIRSPLMALEVLLSEEIGLDNDQLRLVRSATTRIRDIANDLISRPTNDRHERSANGLGKSCLIFPLIEAAITEKRIQFRDRTAIQFESAAEGSAGFAFARVVEPELNRIISNLINNSVEAMEVGCVRVTLRVDDATVIIDVTDNGIGIPSHLLGEIGQKGFTFGKENSHSGSGLGVYHAKKTLLNWGGNLSITSQVSKGTTVSLTLPVSGPPAWFKGLPQVKADTQLVIVDDEPSAMLVWKKIFPNTCLNGFGSVEAFREWKKDRTAIAQHSKAALHIVDYDLRSNCNGLSLIRELAIQGTSVLVTSRYNDETVQKEALNLGVGIIPKDLVKFLPVASETKIMHEVIEAIIYLDDDLANQAAWKMAAKKSGFKVACFTTASDLMAALPSLSKNSSFYIDFSLGAGKPSGLEVCKTLFEAGFERLFLCTGHEKAKISKPAFLTAILDKTPPWIKL
jgi:signal transduction histidine kinase/CheY-like chemotaxis protein